MAEPKLKKEQQIFVVQQLAMYEKAQKVLDELKQIYPDVNITLQAIVRYNITHPKFPKVHKDLFETTRKTFLEKVENIPIANKAVRVKKLQNILDKLEADKLQNNPLQMEVLEQAAKEMGDAFTNKREVTGKNGESLMEPMAQAFGQFNTMLEKVYGNGAGNPNSDNSDSAN